MAKPNSAGCYRQLNSRSLHKQTRRNPLGGDVCSPVENHDLVPSLQDNIKSRTHSRVSECDGQPTVKVKPGPVNRMVTASAGVQTNLSQVVHPSCRSICHSSEPQTATVRVSSPRPECLGHRCSEHKLVGSHCLCLPSYGSPSQGDLKDQTMQLPDHCNSPRLARDALVLGPSAALNRDPTSATSVNNSSQTVPQLCVSQQSTTSQPPRLVSTSGQLQENLLNRRSSTIDGYRTAIVDTLGPAGHHISQSSDLNRLLSSFHRDHPKISRNLPKFFCCT